MNDLVMPNIITVLVSEEASYDASLDRLPRENTSAVAVDLNCTKSNGDRVASVLQIACSILYRNVKYDAGAYYQKDASGFHN